MEDDDGLPDMIRDPNNATRGIKEDENWRMTPIVERPAIVQKSKVTPKCNTPPSDGIPY
jgi:hypothetical protein